MYNPSYVETMSNEARIYKTMSNEAHIHNPSGAAGPLLTFITIVSKRYKYNIQIIQNPLK